MGLGEFTGFHMDAQAICTHRAFILLWSAHPGNRHRPSGLSLPILSLIIGSHLIPTPPSQSQTLWSRQPSKHPHHEGSEAESTPQHRCGFSWHSCYKIYKPRHAHNHTHTKLRTTTHNNTHNHMHSHITHDYTQLHTITQPHAYYHIVIHNQSHIHNHSHNVTYIQVHTQSHTTTHKHTKLYAHHNHIHNQTQPHTMSHITTHTIT